MSKHIELTVPKPCHENWDHMNPTEKGRFCNSCQKQVIDFTGMSDEKLAAFFRKPATQVCGRFRNDQLQKDLTIPQKRIPWVRYFLQAALPAVLVSCRGYTQGEPMKKPVTPLLQQHKSTLAEMEKNIQAPKARILTGQVIDAEGRGISYASIVLQNLSQCSATDGNGFFRLTVNEPDSLIQLDIVHSRYERRTIEIDLAKDDWIPVIRLEKLEEKSEYTTTLGMIMVKQDPPPVKIIPKVVDTGARHFNVFPNPVISGSSLNIELINKLKEGYYHLQVAGLDGKNIFQKEIWIDAEARVMNIELPVITAGHYILSLKNSKTGKVFGEKLVIQ